MCDYVVVIGGRGWQRVRFRSNLQQVTISKHYNSLILLTFFFFISFFIYLHSSSCPPLRSLIHSSSFHSSSPLPPRGFSPSYQASPSLGTQVSQGLSTGTSLLYMYKGPRSSLCMLLVGGLLSGSSLGLWVS